MKAVEVPRILQGSASNRECKRLLACKCRNLVRVMLGGRPGGASSRVPITQEDTDSPQANRRRFQGPLGTSYAPSQGTISELSFRYDPNNIPGINLDLLKI